MTSRLSDAEIAEKRESVTRRDSDYMDVSDLLADREAILAENATLKARLHDQSLATMEASSLISAEVNDAIRRSAGFPEDYTPEGHPAAQNVAMVMARLQAENATLREDAERFLALLEMGGQPLDGEWSVTVYLDAKTLGEGYSDDDIRAAIDAARKANG